MSFDEQPDGDPHGECALEIQRLNELLVAKDAELARETHRADCWVKAARELAQELGLNADDSKGSTQDWKHIKAELARLRPLAEMWEHCELSREMAESLVKAQAKHAPMHSLHEGYAVILEEVDELWDEVRAWQPGADLSKARKEALHVGAMAMRLIHDVCDPMRTTPAEAVAKAMKGEKG